MPKDAKGRQLLGRGRTPGSRHADAPGPDDLMSGLRRTPRTTRPRYERGQGGCSSYSRRSGARITARIPARPGHGRWCPGRQGRTCDAAPRSPVSSHLAPQGPCWLRGLSGRRCRGRHVARGSQGGIGAHRPSRRPADRLGIPRLRVAARLGQDCHRSRCGGHRAHIPAAEGTVSEGAGSTHPDRLAILELLGHARHCRCNELDRSRVDVIEESRANAGQVDGPCRSQLRHTAGRQSGHVASGIGGARHLRHQRTRLEIVDQAGHPAR